MLKLLMLILVLLAGLGQLGCAAVAGGVVGGLVGHEIAEEAEEDEDE